MQILDTGSFFFVNKDTGSFGNSRFALFFKEIFPLLIECADLELGSLVF
jgi:hypothetical protein